MSKLSFLYCNSKRLDYNLYLNNIGLFFSSADFGVSNRLANYLIYAADPGSAISILKGVLSDIDFDGKLESFFESAEIELKVVLKNNSFDIYGLYKAIAIR